MTTVKNAFIFEQEQTIKIAQDLRYSPDVIEKLNLAKSPIELSRIMTTARKRLILQSMKGVV